MGSIFLFILLLSFTTVPFWMYFHLGTSGTEYLRPPQQVVVLGASGMPSEANLLRCYKAAELAATFPETNIIIALPRDPSENLFSSSVYSMKKELMMRGVDSMRIKLEDRGRNTREQALLIAEIIGDNETRTVLVTSPEHMYRSLRAFRKAGFKHAGGEAAFEKALESQLAYRDAKLGGRKVPLPEVGEKMQLRYQFWNHLKYQVICYREYAAIAYYKVRGWI